MFLEHHAGRLKFWGEYYNEFGMEQMGGLVVGDGRWFAYGSARFHRIA